MGNNNREREELRVGFQIYVLKQVTAAVGGPLGSCPIAWGEMTSLEPGAGGKAEQSDPTGCVFRT